ncbi:MAG: hypothetical protein QNJ33_13000 [Crocosphaera sp.]|nr:hypothetical protein [Crocosphaera sp.]
MENNDYINFIKQAYEDKINLYERLLQEKEQTIDKQESEIVYLRNMVDKLLRELNSIKEQLQKESKSVNIEITNTNEGGNVSNINQTSSGSGDNINHELNNVTIGESYAGRDIINNDSSPELQETVNKINQLIDQVSQTNPSNNTSDRLKIASIVIEEIETNPTWKQKAIQACQQGLLEAMKSNPIGAFVAGAIEGWKEQ